MAVGVTHTNRAAKRFRVGYLLLGVLVIVAAAAVVWQMSDDDSSTAAPTAAWSQWAPDAALGVNAILPIADHVSRGYRFANGDQLVSVKASYPGKVGDLDPNAVRAKTLDVSTVVVATTAPDGQVSYSAAFPTYPSTVEFQLCGDSSNCALPASAGGPTAETQKLLHQEGLELALYTFHYIPELSRIIEIFPPGPDGTQSRAVVLSSDQLQPALTAPLAATLPPQLTADQQSAIDQLMDGSSYDYQYQQLYDGTFQMVLSVPKSQ